MDDGKHDILPVAGAILDHARMPVMLPRQSDADMRRDGSTTAQTVPNLPSMSAEECTAPNGLITRHAYSGQAYLYEPPGSDLPPKHFSRWDRLVDRAAALRRTPDSRCTLPAEGGAI